MTRKRRPQGDPIEQEIELVLKPGAFIPYGGSFSFISDLDEVTAKIARLVSSDPARATTLYETFLAGCYVKAEEIDDSSGSFGQFVGDLYCGWITACQAGEVDPDETASRLLTWMDQDDYGFCYRLEMDAVKVFNKANLAAFTRLVRARFDAAMQKTAKKDEKLRWSGLDPWPEQAAPPPRRKRRQKVAATDLDLNSPLDLVVLSVKERAARCRLVGSDRIITLRASLAWDTVPGEIVVVNPRKQWTYAGHPYLSGEIVSSQLDVEALGVVPLKLEDRGIWTPEEHFWGDDDEPIEAWAKPIIAHGPRRSFEMEQVVPGRDPNDFKADPISEANDLKDAGDPATRPKPARHVSLDRGALPRAG